MWVASDDISEPNLLDIDFFLENVLVERKSCPGLPGKLPGRLQRLPADKHTQTTYIHCYWCLGVAEMQRRAKSAAERTSAPAAYLTAEHKYRDFLAGEKEHGIK
jgi:hypothetical protein